MDDATGDAKKILEAQDILSILILPVFVENEFRGYVGFDSCRAEKEWSYVEISLLNSFVLLYVKTLERHILEKKVMQVNENFNNFFNMIQDSLFVLDYEGHIIDINNTVLNKSGYSRDELVGKSVLMLHPKDQAKAAQKNIQDLISGELDCCMIQSITKKGHIFPVETRVTQGLWNGEKALFCISQDITERRKYEEKIRDLSNKDGLTGAYNRRYIYELAEEIIEAYKTKKEIFSVSILDLDNFKLINDSYGHQVGDYVLKEFTKVVRENLSPQDVLGRYGGEEFIIIHPHTDREKCKSTLNQVLNRVGAQNFVHKEHSMKITFSAGMASSEELKTEDINIDQLVQLADTRMYYAKKCGKNQVMGTVPELF